MGAIVVYESHWGSTAAIAHAIADGLGSGTPALNTDEATPEVVRTAELIVAGAPVIGFRLPTESMVKQLVSEQDAPSPPDISHPALRTWLDGLEPGDGWMAAFETRIWWSLRGATGAIESKLKTAGYRKLLPAERFVVAGRYGELRVDELAHGREWGTKLAEALRTR